MTPRRNTTEVQCVGEVQRGVIETDKENPSRLKIFPTEILTFPRMMIRNGLKRKPVAAKEKITESH